MWAKERGAGEVTAYIQRGSPDVIRFAAFYGFGRVGYYREFLRMVYLPLERATFPEGLTVQSYAERSFSEMIPQGRGTGGCRAAQRA